MPPYSQALRPLAVETVLGPDALLLTGLRGTEELSRPYAFVLDLASEARDVDIEALVGTPAAVVIAPPAGDPRFVHGIVRRVRTVGHGTALAAYQAELVPWLWLLSLSTDCRIFQHLSVPEIVQQVFADFGQSHYELRLVRTYPKREYCVQYRETALAFVSRLLEDEGIAYHFAHAADEHTLVLTDSAAGTRPCPGLPTLTPPRNAGGRGEWTGDAYTALAVERALRTRGVALTDYDYEQPSTSLAAEIAADTGLGEAFDYPGGYTARDDGDRYARLRLEATDVERETAEGESGAAALTSGYKATFAGDGPGAGGRTWLVTRVTHDARQGSYLASSNGADADAFSYRNHFALASADAPWRPPRRTPRPRVAGTQSALVVGKSGEEIWTDAQGRVKLHFYWDRRGTLDENASCWVRCSSAWAGRGYGQFSVPRMGQEVLVDFLEGDPDRPVVVGRVYNAENPPPCDPGGGRGVVSGMQSQTHKGSGSNSITMDDTAGKEKVAVHAQYDMTTDVGHDDTQSVANNRSVTIGAKLTEHVTGDVALTHSATFKHDVLGTSTVTVGGDVSETYSAKQTTGVSSDLAVTAGGKVAVQAATEITLTVGGASLTMKADGTITLKGVNITLDGVKVVAQGSAEVSAAAGASSLKLTPPSAELAAALIKSAATGINEVSGATVKLN